jgi:hypothetical protein
MILSKGDGSCLPQMGPAGELIWAGLRLSSPQYEL